MKHFFILVSLIILSAYFGYSQNNSMKTIIDENGRIVHEKSSEFNFVKSSTKENIKNNPMFLSFNWQDNVNLTNNAVTFHDSYLPSVAIGEDRTVYIVYNDEILTPNWIQKIFFTKSTDGLTWSEPVIVDRGASIDDVTTRYGDIKVAANNDLHIIYYVWAYENSRHYMAYTRYDAASETWIDAIRLSETNNVAYSSEYSIHNLYLTDNDNPVVIWGLDNRADENVEEAYMKYFDGTNWSSDILVSTPGDGNSVISPFIRSIGNNKAIIIFAEHTGVDNIKVMKYRIYDETDNSLSDIALLSDIQSAKYNFPFAISQKSDGKLLYAYVKPKTYGTNEYDSIKCVEYDIEQNVFTNIEGGYQYADNSSSYTNSLTISNDNNQNFAFTFPRYFPDRVVSLNFNLETGFDEPTVLYQGLIMIDPYPSAFDNQGNLHVVWADLRNDDPDVQYIEQEIIYKKGKNPNIAIARLYENNINIYPNPTNGIFTIELNEILNTNIEISDISGKIIKQFSANKKKTSIDLTNQTKGIYFIKIMNNKIVKTEKIIIR